jgi:hypothetical protein
LQAFFDARGEAVAIRLPWCVKSGAREQFETLAKTVNGFSLRLRHKVRIVASRGRPKGGDRVVPLSHAIPDDY